MSENYNPMDPMAAGPGSPNPSGPVGPVGPAEPQNPANPGPMFEEETNYTRIYQIALGVLGFLLLVSLIFVLIYANKAGRSQKYWDGVVAQAVDKKDKEDKVSYEQQLKDFKENPWTEYKARDEFGAFKFIVPRTWSQYEYFDINANDPYSIYFSPDTVKYDSAARQNHAALQVVISKKLYSDQVKEIEQKIKMHLDTGATEEKINIANFTGTKFVYQDKDLNKKVGVIVVPYRDRALFIKTDDYDKWNEKYYTKFYNSFALTP